MQYIIPFMDTNNFHPFHMSRGDVRNKTSHYQTRKFLLGLDLTNIPLKVSEVCAKTPYRTISVSGVKN